MVRVSAKKIAIPRLKQQRYSHFFTTEQVLNRLKETQEKQSAHTTEDKKGKLLKLGKRKTAKSREY